MEKHSKLLLSEVKALLSDTSSQLEEIIINDNNFIITGWPDVLSLPRLRTLTVKNRCVFSGLDSSDADHPFVVTKSPLLRSISIGDSFCNNTVFSIGGTSSVRVWHRMWCSRRAEYWRRSNWCLPLCSRAVSVKWLIHFIMICRTPFSSTNYNKKELLHKSGESDAFGWIALRVINHRPSRFEDNWLGRGCIPWSKNERKGSSVLSFQVQRVSHHER